MSPQKGDGDLERKRTTDKGFVFRPNKMDCLRNIQLAKTPSPGCRCEVYPRILGLHPPRMFKVAVQQRLAQPALHKQDASREDAAIWGHLQ